MENIIGNSVSAYIVAKEYFSIMSDMDRVMEEKGKTEDETIRKYLDDKYDELAKELFKVQEKLKMMKVIY